MTACCLVLACHDMQSRPPSPPPPHVHREPAPLGDDGGSALLRAGMWAGEKAGAWLGAWALVAGGERDVLW